MFNFRLGLRSSVLITLFTTLGACGGGGGGSGATSTPQTPSTATFPVAQAYSSMIINGLQQSLSISGKVSGENISGSGTITFAPAIAASFEGQLGMSTLQTLNLTIKVQNNNVPVTIVDTLYYDSNYIRLGDVAGDGTYTLITSSQPLPTAAHVNDSGTLESSTSYLNQSKSFVAGTTTSTYTIDSDRTDSVIFHITSKIYDANHALMETDQYRYRVNTAGNISFVSLEFLTADGDVSHFTAN